MCHPSAPGRDAGDHPAIPPVPPVPGPLHPLSQPAFLLGIKQAGYLVGLCNSESVTLQGGREEGCPLPDYPGSRHCSVVSELFLRLHHWGLGRFTRTPGPLQGCFLLHLTIPLLRVTKSGWLRAEVPWGECGHTSPVVSQHS